MLVLGRSAGLLAGLPRPVYRSGRSGLRSSVIADLSRLLALFVRCKPAICRRSAKDSRMRPSAPTFLSNAVRFDPRPGGIIRAESQRDSVPKPRVASRELPWEKRVVSANPNGVVARWRRGDTTPSVVPFGGTTTCATIRQMAQLQIVTFGTSFDAKWHYRWGWPTPPAFPRVARGSQPWALGRNPFGIQRC